MSDLVEKVQDAIFKAYDFNGIATEKMSRAAIAAVAEWLEHRSLDWPDNAEGKIAAALRAAAGGGEK